MLCKRGLCRHAVSVCPSVCPSVCLSRSWILSKWLIIVSADFFSPSGSQTILDWSYWQTRSIARPLCDSRSTCFHISPRPFTSRFASVMGEIKSLIFSLDFTSGRMPDNLNFVSSQLLSTRWTHLIILYRIFSRMWIKVCQSEHLSQWPTSEMTSPLTMAENTSWQPSSNAKNLTGAVAAAD